MKRVKKAEQNSLVLTLTELTTIDRPNYLFGFLDEQNDVWQYVILDDVSLFPCRFNKFDFTEGVEITFPKVGFFTYKVWEQQSDKNLDPSGLNLVEEGRVVVWDEEQPEPTYESDKKPITYGDNG